jgi:hypothetical protein
MDHALDQFRCMLALATLLRCRQELLRSQFIVLTSWIIWWKTGVLTMNQVRSVNYSTMEVSG